MPAKTLVSDLKSINPRALVMTKAFLVKQCLIGFRYKKTTDKFMSVVFYIYLENYNRLLTVS